MSNYLERFRAMAAEVEAHSHLEVVTFTVNPPASDALIAQLESRLDLALTGPIRDFYQETNGLQLYWRFRLDLTDQELDRMEQEYDDYDIGGLEKGGIEGRNPFAQIHLLPLDDVLVNRDWRGIVYFDETKSFDKSVDFGGKTYLRSQLEMKFRPFDLYSYSSCMALSLAEVEDDYGLLVSRLADHYIEWQDSRITDFGSYMEMILATRGIVQARRAFYQQQGGENLPRLISPPEYWTPEKIPKLFRK